MKVTDRRMFTNDGELREEYRFLEQQQQGADAGTPPPAADQVASSGPGDATAGADARHMERPPADPEPGPGAAADPYQVSSASGGAPAAGFMDLVAMLAEPIAFLLGDAQLPDGGSAQDLPRARLHIDLLAVLQEKTRGNVTAQETALLDDLLAQLRLRYVEKTRN